jgi:hypothetical protein
LNFFQKILSLRVVFVIVHLNLIVIVTQLKDSLVASCQLVVKFRHVLIAFLRLIIPKLVTLARESLITFFNMYTKIMQFIVCIVVLLGFSVLRFGLVWFFVFWLRRNGFVACFFLPFSCHKFFVLHQVLCEVAA